MKPDRDLLATVTRNRKCGDPHCHAGLSRIADASCDRCYSTVGDVRSIAQGGEACHLRPGHHLPRTETGRIRRTTGSDVGGCKSIECLPRAYCRPYRNTLPIQPTQDRTPEPGKQPSAPRNRHLRTETGRIRSTPGSNAEIRQTLRI